MGYERLAAWSGLLDRINVFPVADADTGQNLKISLAPLRWPVSDHQALTRDLLMCATGNSGNIAAAFLAGLLTARDAADLGRAIQNGRTQADQAVGDPQPGTMLTVFETLAVHINDGQWQASAANCAGVIQSLQETVAATAEILPELKQAGVVDAGALGMFIFLEAFLLEVCGVPQSLRPMTEIFPRKLAIAPGWQAGRYAADYCVNTMVRADKPPREIQRRLAGCGASLVLNATSEGLKLHMHTADRKALRSRVESLGAIVTWSEEAMADHLPKDLAANGAVHLLTDAAGSITSEDARRLGLTLLNSYLVVDGQAWPETLYPPDRLYAAMAGGNKVSTAQASRFERQQSFLSAVNLHPKVLYLCVGSAYTGNYAAATTWREGNTSPDRFDVIDTGAASGRLAVIVWDVARFVRGCSDLQAIRQRARAAMEHSQEFVFLDQLKFLAAGGRISRSSGFFGDLLHLKPVISPTRRGAVKVAVMRNRREQLDFALKRLKQVFAAEQRPLILVQYSDNRSWVETQALPQLQSRLPLAELILRPLSLTSGAHMGPGTWAVAFMPEMDTAADFT